MNIVDFKQKLLNNSKIVRNVVYQLHKRATLADPYAEANRVYRECFGKDIDWNNPKDMMEKIYWLMFNTDTSLWTRCADKYRVREYVENAGLSEMLPKLYGMWERAEDVDFDSLPNQFVLKANNGSGTVEIVRNKSSLDIKKMRRMMKEWLAYTYGYNGAQMFYTKIKPCIIAEELHPTIDNKSLVDYKIWCFNGKPESVWVAYDRKKVGAVKMALFDLDWNPLPQNLKSTPHYIYEPNDVIPRPDSLDEMLAACRKLTKPFREVRADFYDVNGKAYFGELTFLSGYGFYTKDYYDYLGSKICLEDLKF